MSKPIIVIVGRPNVGKSTLFNRLVGRRAAVTAEEPGTTRDRISLDAAWEGRSFIIVDTGGLEHGNIAPKAPIRHALGGEHPAAGSAPSPQANLLEEIEEQVEAAIESADAIVFLTDVRDGVTPLDLEIRDRLRRWEKPVFLAVNKVDNPKLFQSTSEFYELSLGDPIPISAHHNLGMDYLMDAVIERLPSADYEEAEQEETLSLAIVGRVNVGKSSLLNAILGEERAIVSDVPGTTRDAIDTSLQYKGQQFLIIDTAGIRRRGKVVPGIENFSVLRSIRSIDRADVVFLVFDASELATAQDAHILGEVANAFKGVVVLVNKWDLADELELNEAACIALIRDKIRFIPYAPIRFVSAVQESGIDEALDAALMVFNDLKKEVPQDKLTSEVLSAMSRHLPPHKGKRYLKLNRVAQEGVNPPTFAFYVNHPDLMHFSYQRYLENRLRETLGFRWSHLKLEFKNGRKK